MLQKFLLAVFLTLGVGQVTLAKEFIDYCNGQFPGNVTKDEAITVGYLKLVLKYKAPLPFKISTRAIYGKNGEVLKPMDAVPSFFWYIHPSDFNLKFKNIDEVSNFLIEQFSNKENCRSMADKMNREMENLELSMPAIPIKGSSVVMEYKLTTLAPLNGARKLKRLNVINHNISGRGHPVLNLPALEELKMTNSGVEDITFIQNLTSLKVLALGKNKIFLITPLKNLNRLEDIELYDNKIKDLSPLSSLPNLYFLSLGGNYLTDISPLRNLNKLNFLSIATNRRISGEFGVGNINPVQNMIALRELNIKDNKITDLSPISELKNLLRLDVSSNGFSNCEPLATLKRTNRKLVITNVKNKCQ